jgi:hypothetical protein
MTSADVRKRPCKGDMKGTAAASINSAQRSFWRFAGILGRDMVRLKRPAPIT